MAWTDEEVLGLVPKAAVPRGLTDEEVLGAPPSPPQAPALRQGLSDEEVLGGGGDTATPIARGSAATRAPAEPGALRRGFTVGLWQQTPELWASAAEGAADLAGTGEDPNSTLNQAGKALRDYAKTSVSPEYALKATKGTIFDSKDFGDFLTRFGEGAGSAFSSVIPSLAGGVVGGVAGTAIGGPVGTVVGGGAGLGVGSYIPNFGEVRTALLEEKVPRERASKLAAVWAAPMAALDATGEIGALMRITGKARGEIVKGLARRMAEGAAKTGAIEGSTEAAQEYLKQVAIGWETGKPIHTAENLKEAAQSGLFGAVPGMGMGAVSGMPRPGVKAPGPATDQEILDAHSVVAGTPPTAIPNEQPPAWSGVTPPEGGPDAASLSRGLDKIFYSRVEQVVREKGPNSATPAQWLATVQNTPGVKAEEVEALGLGSFLRGRDKVTKDELLSHIEENMVDVDEVTLRPMGPAKLDWVPIDPQGQSHAVWEAETPAGPVRIVLENDDRFHVYTVSGEDQGYYSEHDTFEAADGLVRREFVEEGQPGRASYETYTVPGGQNYREVLLTLPRTEQGTNLGPKGWSNTSSPRAQEGSTQYRGPHWDQPNVVSHIRVKDRVDVTGVPMLFIEELQSDWHQEGRKKGYRSEERIRVLRERQRQLDVDYAAAAEEGSRLDQAITDHLRHENPMWRENGPEATRIYQELAAQRQAAYEHSKSIYDEANRLTGEIMEAKTAPPEAPFKTSWVELSLKRMLRLAAENGQTRVAWTPGEIHTARWRQQGDVAAGQAEFYDKIVGRVMAKLAKQVGGTVGQTEILFPDAYGGTSSYTVPYIDLPPAALERLYTQPQMLFSRASEPMSASPTDVSGRTSQIVPMPGLDGTDLGPSVRRGWMLIENLAQRLGISSRIEFVVIGDPKYYGWFMDTHKKGVKVRDSYTIAINPSQHVSAAQVWATLAHEFGHLIHFDSFRNTDEAVKTALNDVWMEMNLDLAEGPGRLHDLAMQRYNFITTGHPSEYPGVPRGFHPTNNMRELANLPANEFLYYTGFEEFMAEQAARWVLDQTAEQNTPRGVVDTYFSALGRKIKEIHAGFAAEFPDFETQAPEFIRSWLDSLVTQPFMIAMHADEYFRRTMAENSAAMKAFGAKWWPDSPRSAVGSTIRKGFLKIFGPNLPVEGKASVAAMDNWARWLWMWRTLTFTAERNPGHMPLQLYKSAVDARNRMIGQIQTAAEKTIRKANDLNSTQTEALNKLIDDYINYRFLSLKEKQAGVERRPSAEEFAKLVKNAKADRASLAVFQQMVTDYDFFLDRHYDVVARETVSLSPELQATKLEALEAHRALMKQKAYFPALRYGNYTVTVRGPNGNVIAFERFETQREQQNRLKWWQGNLEEGERIDAGLLDKSIEPFAGIPGPMLDLMLRKLNLSPAQKEQVQLLKWEMAPEQSFVHRFQSRKLTPGYSRDFVRAYASYFHHASHYLANQTYFPQLTEHINAARDISKQVGFVPTDPKQQNRLDRIYHGMLEHFEKTIRNPMGDFATSRIAATFMFLWAVPSTAALNLIQTPTVTLPHLASEFGDAVATKQLLKELARFKNFYRQTTVENMTAPESRALAELMELGVIKGALAPELIGLSQGTNLQRTWGGNTAQRIAVGVMKVGMSMQEGAEQLNRRAAGMATYNLAMQQPGNAFVLDSVRKNPELFDQLQKKGFSTEQAAAIVAAERMIHRTQFQYSREFRPPMMQGLGAVFLVFQMFKNSLLLGMGAHKGAAVRQLFIFAALFGVMGMPGADDIARLMKALAWRLFGKDFDLEQEVRKYAKDALGWDRPDLLARGFASRGFGLPALSEFLLRSAGIQQKVPEFDMSAAGGVGPIIPVDTGKLFGPGAGQNPARAAVEGLVVPAAGAFMGSYAYNAYKAMAGNGPMGGSQFDRLLPRGLADISRSYRAASDGAIKNSRGEPVLKFDVRNNPEHAIEVAQMALGFQPKRVADYWKALIEGNDQKQYWDIRSALLRSQLNRAVLDGQKEEINHMIEQIKAFNAEVKGTAAAPKAITVPSLQQSLRNAAKSRVLHEQGQPTNPKDRMIYEEIRRLYPGANLDLRAVR